MVNMAWVAEELYREARRLLDEGRYLPSLVLARQSLEAHPRKGEPAASAVAEELDRAYLKLVRTGSVSEEELRALLNRLGSALGLDEGEYAGVIINVDIVDVLIGAGIVAVALSFLLKTEVVWADAVRIPALTLLVLMAVKRALAARAERRRGSVDREANLLSR